MPIDAPLTPFRETWKFKVGADGEQRVARLLQELGWYIIPCYDFTGEDDDKAPKMDGLKDGLILPDLDACKSGQRKWAEVKTKAKADYHRNTGRLVHGIPIRHYEHYQRVEAESGNPVYLFVYEQDTGDVLSGRLTKLPVNHVYYGSKMSRGGMIFFARDSFRWIANVHGE